MTQLQMAPNLENADDFYAALLAAHDGLNEADMHALNARLILVLANHIGDQAVLEAAIGVAKVSSPGAQM